MKTCVKCGVAKPFSDFKKSKSCSDGYFGQCKQCDSIYQKEYRKNNKEKIRALTDAWRKANRERMLESMRLNYQANKEIRLEQAAQWAKANPEKRKLANKKWASKNKPLLNKKALLWYHANPEKCAAKAKRYRLNNPEVFANISARRRAATSGKLSKGIKQKLFTLQKGLCPCCKLPLGDNYHVDHIVPISKGGLNVDSNVQLLRAECNLKKNAKDPIEYMQSKGFLL